MASESVDVAPPAELLEPVSRYIERTGLSLLVLNDRIRRLDVGIEGPLTTADRGIVELGGFLRPVVEAIGGVSVILPLALPGFAVDLANVCLAAAITLGRLGLHVLREFAWAMSRGALVSLFSALRSIPPMIAVLLFLFITADAWKMFGPLPGMRFGLLDAALLAGGFWFAWFRLGAARRELYGACLHPSRELRTLAEQTPAKRLVDLGFTPRPVPRGRLVRLNLAVAVATPLATRIAAVALWVTVGFLLIGAVVIDRPLAAEMLSRPPNVIGEISIRGMSLTLTWELVHVSVLFGAIAAFYLAGPGLPDDKAVQSFIDDVFTRLKRAMAASAYYHGARDAGAR